MLPYVFDFSIIHVFEKTFKILCYDLWPIILYHNIGIMFYIIIYINNIYFFVFIVLNLIFYYIIVNSNNICN